MHEAHKNDGKILDNLEPREGLWYGRVLLVNKVIHTLISDSLERQPNRLVKFMTTSLPVEIVVALEPEQKFWLDLTAARELRATFIDTRFFGIIPPDLIT